MGERESERDRERESKRYRKIYMKKDKSKVERNIGKITEIPLND